MLVMKAVTNVVAAESAVLIRILNGYIQKAGMELSFDSGDRSESRDEGWRLCYFRG